MIVGTFGVGFVAGIVTTQLVSGPTPEPARIALLRDADLAPGAGLDSGPWLAGVVEPAPIAVPPAGLGVHRVLSGPSQTAAGRSASETLHALPEAGQATAPRPPLEAPQHLRRPNQTLAGLTATEAPEALPHTGMAATLRSATETLQAPPAAAQVATLAPPGPRLDGLTSAAEDRQEARLDKAALLERPGSVEQILVRRGDTLMDILTRARISQAEAYAAVESLRTVYDPRRLRAGQELALTAAAADDPADERRRQLLGLSFDLSFDHQIQVVRSADGGYDATMTERPQQRQMVRRAGVIDDSLYLAAKRVALPLDVTNGLIKLFSWDVDFQRDLRPGDGFETLFDEVSLEDGSGAVRGGDLLYGGLMLSGKLLDAYRFEVEAGEVEFFDRTGKSLRKFLMRTPVDGARLSSSFGMRKHPILGYSLMHKGVDFAAPPGTPIFAAGSGRVAVAGRNGGYGNYIRLRHSSEYSTAYGHLARFATGVRPGERVHQGQVIGYVGTTGRSTGPHLHYEVLRNDTQINPLSVKQPPTMQLAGADLKRFQGEVGRIDLLRAELAHGTQVASRVEDRRAAN